MINSGSKITVTDGSITGGSTAGIYVADDGEVIDVSGAVLSGAIYAVFCGGGTENVTSLSGGNSCKAGWERFTAVA